MSLASTLIVWASLLVLVGAQFLLAHFPHLGAYVPLLGVASALLVALTFMRLSSAAGLAKIFALAGGFWLLVMLGLGSLDTVTRHDLPAPTLTGSAQGGADAR